MQTNIPYGTIGAPSLWPIDKAGVMAVAQDWYAPARVAINEAAIAALPNGTIVVPELTDLTIQVRNDPRLLIESMEYSIAHNSINHRFWSLDEQGAFRRYQKDGVVGATLMTHLFAAAWHDENSPIQQARRGTPMSVADVRGMFGDIPDADGRARILNEVLTSPALHEMGLRLAEDAQLGVTFDTHHAWELAERFPQAYGDEVLKKSQLAVSAAWRNAREHGQSLECDLTAFADYQVPNVLRALGLLTYADDLAARIDGYQIIDENSVDERAIRGASIIACERLAAQQGVNVADVDYWIWAKRKEPKTPFHLTLTDAY